MYRLTKYDDLPKEETITLLVGDIVMGNQGTIYIIESIKGQSEHIEATVTLRRIK